MPDRQQPQRQQGNARKAFCNVKPWCLRPHYYRDYRMENLYVKPVKLMDDKMSDVSARQWLKSVTAFDLRGQLNATQMKTDAKKRLKKVVPGNIQSQTHLAWYLQSSGQWFGNKIVCQSSTCSFILPAPASGALLQAGACFFCGIFHQPGY